MVTIYSTNDKNKIIKEFPELDTLAGADLSYQDLSFGDFRGMDVRNTDFHGADLDGAEFDEDVFESWRFDAPDFTDTCFEMIKGDGIFTSDKFGGY